MEQQLLFSPIQKQKITQNQIQSLNILAMDNIELNEFLKKEYEENPLLELTGTPLPPVEYHQKTPSSLYGFNYDAPFKEEAAKDSDSFFNLFLDQLNPFLYTSEEWGVFRLLIMLLDEHGFFPYSPEEISDLFSLEADTVANCLFILKGLKPVGIFQPDLASHLKYQLEYKGQNDPNLFYLIDHHLSDIANKDYRKISKATDLCLSLVKELVLKLQNLSPTPLHSYDHSDSKDNYIIPDILAKHESGKWEISLNDNWIGNYAISDYYLHMMKNTSDKEARAFFLEKYQRSKFIIERIDQRRSTILKICNKIMEIQSPFFDGSGPLSPMTMADISRELDICVSTVSRGIKNKYLQYPRGIVLLKSLFTSGLTSENGDNISSDAIVSMIIKLVHSEDKKRPYSDSKIVDLLKNQGVLISRRTVTKYRLRENIPSASERKNSPP